MSYTYKILKDHPIGFWPLDESSGSIVHDYSGCLNNGQYHNFTSFDNLIPLVSGGQRSTLINDVKYIELSIGSDYVGETAKGSFATKSSSDNDFSLELWAYIKDPDSTNIPLFSNESGTGIFVQNGGVYFYVNSEYVCVSPNTFNETLHIVGTYRQNVLNLFINGKLLAYKQLNNFQFSNELPLSMLIGPCQTGESFIIDAPAVYRYALTELQINNHFNAFQPIRPIQIVQPDGGVIFSGSDSEAPKAFVFSYPLTKSFNNLKSTNTYYDSSENYITVADGYADAFIYDTVNIPAGLPLISSKIEWNSDQGIVVSVSYDGPDGTYIYCDNGHTLPLWQSFNQNSSIDIKVQILGNTLDTIKPRLENLSLYFYTEKNMYADNSGDFISTEAPLGGSIDTSVWDYSAGSEPYPVLRRNKKSGIKPDLEAGFAINTVSDIASVEFIYRSSESMTANTLVSNESGWYSWNSAGLVDSSGVDIYINGVLFTGSQITNIIIPDEIYHVVVNFQTPATGKIFINSKVASGLWSLGGQGHGYSNIAIYPYALTSSKILEHYGLYTESAYSYSDPVSMNMTETGVFAYDNDWQVIKSV